MTDRDHFAAAALTGLLARPDIDDDPLEFGLLIDHAYKWADAMLRERGNTNHDAAPAARASESPCAGHAGTGGTPVSQPLPVFASGSGSVTPVSHVETDEKRVLYDTNLGTTPPRNGALSGRETVPDPDSRVWETQRTPQPHATPPQGSVQGEGSVRDSRTENEPVAWAMVEADGRIEATFTDKDEAAEWCDESQRIVPLYRQPQPTLTDAERAAVEAAIKCADLYDEEMDGFASGVSKTLRGLLERFGGRNG